MTELKLYNSQGERLDTDSPEHSQQIENFFFGGVRLYIDTTNRTKLTVFYRARESEASRAEQYYAVYETDSNRDLFERFTTALERKVEQEQNMMIQTTTDDTQVFAGLTTSYAAPKGDIDHSRIQSLLSEGEQLAFGVPNPSDALGFFQQYLKDTPQTIAIVEDADNEELTDCELVIEVGSYDGLTPLGRTETLLEEQPQTQTPNSDLSNMQTGTDTDSTTKAYTDKIEDIAKFGALFIGIFFLLLLIVVVIATIGDIAALDAFDLTG